MARKLKAGWDKFLRFSQVRGMDMIGLAFVLTFLSRNHLFALFVRGFMLLELFILWQVNEQWSARIIYIILGLYCAFSIFCILFYRLTGTYFMGWNTSDDFRKTKAKHGVSVALLLTMCLLTGARDPCWLALLAPISRPSRPAALGEQFYESSGIYS